MILSNLAFKNLKRQFNYYLMYFICMIFSVIVYYCFVSMSYDEHFLAEASEDVRIGTGLRAGSIIIILFIIVFMFYANSLFIKRRKREIGLYRLLGMRRRQISGLLFLENTILGAMALFIGISLGVTFSRLFAMILMKFMHISVMSHCILSFAAIKNTVIVFFVILLAVSIRTVVIVSRFKLITLFKADHQSDGPLVVRWYNWILGLLGLLLLVCGYYLANHFFLFVRWSLIYIKDGDVFTLVGPIIILFICIVGTYLLFAHFLVIVLKMISKNKRYYYRDIHMVTSGNLIFNLRKNGRTFATIAILSGTALAAIGGAASFQSYVLNWQNYSNPTSYAVEDHYYQKLKQVLSDEKAPISKEVKLDFKLVGGNFNYTIDFGTQSGNEMYNVISLSNYNNAKKIINNSPRIVLKKEKDVAILGNLNQSYDDKLTTYDKKGLLGNVGQVDVVDYVPDTLGNREDMRISGKTIVVTDDLYEKLEAPYSYSYHLVDVEGSDKNAELAKATLKAFNTEEKEVYVLLTEVEEKNGIVISSVELLDELPQYDYSDNHYIENTFSARYYNYRKMTKSTGLLNYVAVFLGMIFMIATGSIISLKQLSEAEDRIKNYDLLRKLGTPEHIIKRNVYSQNKIVFFTPLLVSLMHAYFAIQVLLALIGAQNMKLTYIAVIFLLGIYATLYYITSSTYYRIINQ